MRVWLEPASTGPLLLSYEYPLGVLICGFFRVRRAFSEGMLLYQYLNGRARGVFFRNWVAAKRDSYGAGLSCTILDHLISVRFNT